MTNIETDLDSAYNQAFLGGTTLEALEGVFDSHNPTYSGGAKADLRRSDGTVAAASPTVTGTYLASNGDAGKLVHVVGGGTVLLTASNGAMTSTAAGDANILTGSGFTRAHVGRQITVTGVGTAGATVRGRVWGLIDSTHIRLTFNATTTASSQTYTISEDLYAIATASTATTLTLDTNAGTSITTAQVWLGTDDQPAIQACITAAEASTGAGNGYTVVIHGPSALGAGLLMTKPGHLMGFGSPGYSSLLGHGTSRLRPMKAGLTVLTWGSSTTGLGVRGTYTTGTGVLTDPDANFVAGDVGKAIYVMGAKGAQTSSTTQGWLETTIASRSSATQVTLTSTTGVTTSDTIYTYGDGIGQSFAGPTMSRIHIEGGSANQKCGMHIMNIGGTTLDLCTISDFYGGAALVTDRGTGFNAALELRNVNLCDSLTHLACFASDITFTGYNNIDGNSNSVQFWPPQAVIGIASNNCSLKSGPTINIQACGTWCRIDGSGTTSMYGCRAECVPYGIIIGTDSLGITDVNFIGNKGSRMRFSAIDSTTVGNSASVGKKKGLVLLANVSDFGFDPGMYYDADTDMFGACDAGSLTRLRRLDDESISKAGAISDSDFSHPPLDGWMGVDTLNNHFQARIGGVWKYATLTGMASRVKKIATQQQNGGSTTLVLTCPVGMTAIPVGHHVAIAVGYGQGSTVTIAAADSKSNTYVKNIQADLNTGNTPHAAILIGRVTTQLVAGDTITVTFGSSVNLSDAIAYEYAGLASSSWIDGTSIGATGTSTTPSSGNDTTTQASDLLLSVTYHAAATTTAGANWTLVDSQDNVGTKRLDVQEQIVFATGTYAGTCTLSGSVDWATVLVAAKAA